MKLNIGGITEAGQSKKNETGTWRYRFPLINEEMCNGCGICELLCPDSCVIMKDNIASVDKFYCKGCGICAYECSQNAIIMQPEGDIQDE